MKDAALLRLPCSLIAVLEPGVHIVGMTVHKGRLLVATDCGIYQLCSDEAGVESLVPIRLEPMPAQEH